MEADEDESIARLNAYLLADDELAAVVRTHTYIEHELISFIEARVALAHALKPLNLDYAGRVSLAIALGLPKELKPALTALGTLRNAFAHRLDASLTAERVDQIYAAFSPKMKETAQKAYKQTSLKVRGEKNPNALSTLPPRERFMIYMSSLYAILFFCNSRIVRIANEKLSVLDFRTVKAAASKG
jgi:hypothetical protein